MATMYGIDWVRLYVLNELIKQPASVSDLLIRREQQSHGGWQFPGRHFLRAPLSDRRAALLACCGDKEVVAYVDDEELGDWRELTSDELLLGLESTCLTNMLVAVSEHGHAKWEQLFQPDWSRFWILNDVQCDEPGNGETMDITCAGDQIAAELFADAHLLFGLDSRTPVQQVGSWTEFGVQVTFWKVMATVKRVQWRGTSVTTELKELMRTCAPGDPKVSSLAQHRVPETRAAIKRLIRLSSKWKCVDDASTIGDDALPELLDLSEAKTDAPSDDGPQQ